MPCVTGSQKNEQLFWHRAFTELAVVWLTTKYEVFENREVQSHLNSVLLQIPR